MMRLTVLYGHPDDPAAFDKYYEEVHLPLAKQMEGWQGWTIGKCQSMDPAEQPPYYMIVGLYAESREAIDAILASPAGQAAVADVPKFATGGATFLLDEEQVILPLGLRATD